MQAMHERRKIRFRQNRIPLTAHRSLTIPACAATLPDEGSKARPLYRLVFFFDEFRFRPRNADE